MDATITQGSIRVRSDQGLINSWVARTANVRVEFLRCRPNTTVEWRAARPEISIVWVRNRAVASRLRLPGGEVDRGRSDRANLWFIPECIDADGELTGESTYDCAGVFIAPTFLPPAAKQTLSAPLVGFHHDALGQAFNVLPEELAKSDEMLPFFTEGWAMQALAYVVRAAHQAPARRPGGLALWQLRRAKEILRANLAENTSLQHVAIACNLSVGHFYHAFKKSTGVSPHKWLISERLEKAQDLLMNSTTPLVEIACICGFADQSHFTRVFGRMAGKSPSAWRRGHQLNLIPARARWEEPDAKSHHARD
jgi:AraC family transcriptional regulator